MYIELYKIITGKYDSNCGLRLYLRCDTVRASVTRGNNFELVPQHCRYDLRKYYFINRVVSIDKFQSYERKQSGHFLMNHAEGF